MLLAATCVSPLPADGARWYTVCGKPYTDRSRWLAGVAGLGALASALFAYLFGIVGRLRNRAGEYSPDAIPPPTTPSA